MGALLPCAMKRKGNVIVILKIILGFQIYWSLLVRVSDQITSSVMAFSLLYLECHEMVYNSAVLGMILLGVTVKAGIECVCYHSAWKKMHSYRPSLDICTLLEVAIDGFINSFTKHKKICLMLLMFQVKTLTLMSACGIKISVICTCIYFLPQGRCAEKSLMSCWFVCTRLHRNSRSNELHEGFLKR